MKIETLFLDLEINANVPKQVFSALGFPEFNEGSSVNSLNGEYSAASVFGACIKLEGNTYDYEDSYRYMISVYKDRLTENVIDEEIIPTLAKVVARLLADNLGIEIAQEIEGGLKTYKPLKSS